MSLPSKQISDHLRTADKEIKAGNLDAAMGYINRIFELEQKNVYARAYKERIISLFEAQGLSRIDAEQRALRAVIPAPPPPTAGPETPPVAVPVPPPAPKPVPPPVRTAAPVPPPAPVPAPQAPAKQSAPPAPQKSVPASSAPVTPAVAPKLSPIRRSPVAAEAYKSLLMEIWKDGLISNDEQSRVDSMRDTFAIAQDEHAQIEKEVRITCYLHAIREEWKRGITDFSATRKRFLITDQEQISIEPRLFQLLQSLQANGSVLVLDDDQSFLSIIKGVLEDGSYYCFTAATGEEGLQLIETMTPDIVICDINFSKPHMSGFAFYEKFRSIDKFLTTPFIFLSGLDQDVLVRTGKKLGADDYLFKPIDAEMLLATVEGKLRRSRELKRAL